MGIKISRILVTGGAGFIGSAVIRHLIQNTTWAVVNLDKLTYAGNLDSLKSISGSPQYTFEHADICSAKDVRRIIKNFRPDAVMHLAAESHVDRSIDDAAEFIQTNVVGTSVLLTEVCAYWRELDQAARARFRFHHISTDEVYGDLEKPEDFFVETSPYNPSSPYSASKASSDHLVRAWGRTYGLPIMITNCSNNYGPYQFPEKLIPLMILNALEGKSLPIYGNGHQIRDWLYVEDHAAALTKVVTEGAIGETYNVGGRSEMKNIEVVRAVCKVLEELAPNRKAGRKTYEELITFVPDRPGHDKRYAIDATKIEKELGWSPKETFESGLRKTVQWYLANEDWWSRIVEEAYQRQRLGLLQRL